MNAHLNPKYSAAYLLVFTLSSSKILSYIVLQEIAASKKKQFLDIACGFGIWGKFIKKGSYASYLVGLDIWKPYLMKIRGQHIYDDLVLADAAHLPFKERSFDVVIACEIIEHLPTELGLSMLFHCERTAREKVILSTPNYHYQQGPARGNPFEEHVSFWKDSDFKKAGYKVRGIGIKSANGFAFSWIPLLGNFLGRVIMPERFSHFAELIVGVKLKGETYS